VEFFSKTTANDGPGAGMNLLQCKVATVPVRNLFRFKDVSSCSIRHYLADLWARSRGVG